MYLNLIITDNTSKRENYGMAAEGEKGCHYKTAALKLLRYIQSFYSQLLECIKVQLIVAD